MIQGKKDKEMTTSISVQVQSDLIIYLNIFFINNMLDLATRVFKDMNTKRDKLLSSASTKSVKKHILDGFQVLTKIREIAA